MDLEKLRRNTYLYEKLRTYYIDEVADFEVDSEDLERQVYDELYAAGLEYTPGSIRYSVGGGQGDGASFACTFTPQHMTRIRAIALDSPDAKLRDWPEGVRRIEIEKATHDLRAEYPMVYLLDAMGDLDVTVTRNAHSFYAHENTMQIEYESPLLDEYQHNPDGDYGDIMLDDFISPDMRMYNGMPYSEVLDVVRDQLEGFMYEVLDICKDIAKVVHSDLQADFERPYSTEAFEEWVQDQTATELNRCIKRALEAA